MSHSPEPWEVEEGPFSIGIYDKESGNVARLANPQLDNKANGDRIAACVNACVGVKIEVLEEVMRGEAILVLGSSEEMREVAQQIARDSNDFEVLCSECGRALPPVAAPKSEKAKEDPKC